MKHKNVKCDAGENGLGAWGKILDLQQELVNERSRRFAQAEMCEQLRREIALLKKGASHMKLQAEIDALKRENAALREIEKALSSAATKD